MPTKLTDEIISAAIDGLQAKRLKLDDQIAELRAMLKGAPSNNGASASESRGRRGGRFSAAARAKMAEAQRRRWAKARGEEGPAESTSAAKPKRKMSAAGRKAIADATRKRWEEFRAAKAQRAKAARKAPAARKKKTTAKKAAAAPAAAQAAS